MWFQKQRAEREERRGRQKRKEQPLKQEATSLEKAKREYDLWVLAEEYEEDGKLEQDFLHCENAAAVL